jgi:hypothetical protein
MKPSNIILALSFTCASFVAKSQTSDAEAEAIINLLGVQKREAIAKLVAVPKKDSATFWKLYSAYEKENKKIALSRLSLYERTAAAYNNMTPAVADSLSKQYFSNRLSQEKSLEDYYKKIKASINSVVAFEFYQAEVYMLTQLRAVIMQQIPTYGQLKLAQHK